MLDSQAAHNKMLEFARPIVQHRADKAIAQMTAQLQWTETELAKAIERRRKLGCSAHIRTIKDQAHAVWSAQTDLIRNLEPRGAQNFASVTDGAPNTKAAWETAKEKLQRVCDCRDSISALDAYFQEERIDELEFQLILLPFLQVARQALSFN